MATHSFLARRLIAAAAIAGLGFGASTAIAGGMSLRTLGAQETRMETIGYRIATANADKCASPMAMSGLIVHDLTQYPRESRPAVAAAFSLREGIGVLGIVAGSGADRAGLRIDDEIVAIDGQPVTDPNVWSQPATGYDRIDRFHAAMAGAMARQPASVTVRRGGQLATLTLTLTGQLGCGGLVKYVDSASVNAWSDGRHVVINRAIADMAQDESQLAFVIAHEMAHNILGHSSAGSRESRYLFGRLFNAASPRNEESQADIGAVALVKQAGFDPRGGIRFLALAGQRMWWAIALDRPSFGHRARDIGQAIARIDAQDVAIAGRRSLQAEPRKIAELARGQGRYLDGDQDFPIATKSNERISRG